MRAFSSSRPRFFPLSFRQHSRVISDTAPLAGKHNTSDTGRCEPGERRGPEPEHPRHLLRGNAPAAAPGQRSPGRRQRKHGRGKGAAGPPGPAAPAQPRLGPPRCCRPSQGPPAPRPPKGEGKRAAASRPAAPAGPGEEKRSRKGAGQPRHRPAPLRAARSGCAGPARPAGCVCEGREDFQMCPAGSSSHASASGLSLWVRRGEVSAGLGSGAIPCLAQRMLSQRLAAVHCPAKVQPGEALSRDEQGADIIARAENQHNSHAGHKLLAVLRGPAELMEAVRTEDVHVLPPGVSAGAGYKPRSLGHPITSAPGAIGVCCHTHKRRGDKDIYRGPTLTS